MKAASGIDEPSEAIYALVGKIALYWTYLERNLEIAIWHLLGDIEFGHILTTDVHNQKLAEIFREGVKHRGFRPEEIALVEQALAGFDRLRANRNSIIHGMHFTESDKGFVLFGKRRKVRFMHNFDRYEIKVESLKGLVGELEAWGVFFSKLSGWVMSRQNFEELRKTRPEVPLPSWPDIPPLPEKLTPLPQ